MRTAVCWARHVEKDGQQLLAPDLLLKSVCRLPRMQSVACQSAAVIASQTVPEAPQNSGDAKWQHGGRHLGLARTKVWVVDVGHADRLPAG